MGTNGASPILPAFRFHPKWGSAAQRMSAGVGLPSSQMRNRGDFASTPTMGTPSGLRADMNRRRQTGRSLEGHVMQSATMHSTRPASSRTPTVHLTRILCPTDASEVSRHARDYAIALAQWYSGEITGLTVLPGIPPAAALPEFAPSLVMAEGTTGGGAERAREALGTFLAPAVKAGIVTHAVVEEGNPADHILAAAGRMPADLIVMGTHGLRGFEDRPAARTIPVTNHGRGCRWQLFAKFTRRTDQYHRTIACAIRDRRGVARS